MTNKEKVFFKAILRAIDGGNFDGWLNSLRSRICPGMGKIYLVGNSEVTDQLIREVKADPEFYRVHLFPELGGLQIETT